MTCCQSTRPLHFAAERKVTPALTIQFPSPSSSSFPDARLVGTGISCIRGFRTLFSDLNLELTSGNSVQVTGPNGAGKTSLLRILATLSLPETGQLFWNDVQVERATSMYHSALSFLGHKQALKQDLTPAENLVSHLHVHSIPPSQASCMQLVSDSLSLMGVGKAQNRPVRQLSAGQRQRVALARVAMVPAPLWILDEPATALDAEGIELLCRMIGDHLGRRGMLIFTSHQKLPFPGPEPVLLDIKP